MQRIIALAVILLAFIGGLRIPGLPWWALAIGMAILALAAWRLSTCSHPSPLALLPATTELDGTPLPPRWFCDRCGKSWPANFEKEQKPVYKFNGYDESKAVHAARRATELADRQRQLALQRAGLRAASKRAKTVREPVHAPDSADVVPIGQGRRLVG
jgi:hypothetical protein